MIEYKTPAEVQAMRPAGAFVAQVLHTLRSEVTVGTDLLDVDARVRELVEARGGVSCYVDYHPSFGDSPFGHYICTSVNDAVLHGLPHRYRLRNGDLVSLDLAVQVDGWVADSAISFVVGQAAPQDLLLIETCEQALAAAIDVAEVGNRIGDLSAAIGQVAQAAGYAVNTQFGGHGVGRTMHGEPHVPNDGRAGRGLVLRPGLVIAIEPWLMATTDRLVKDPDGWTLRSADGSRTAHAEHTVAITPDGPLVLTDRSHLG
ncbi:type I methionyl aminopeptidase [Arsenicicoccus dermatophilus]|uniref:type I methionyl aminopeptidase n=1 Tax=Arsenicicoccus dermatophilus TaxID=1076331 RepID=UPI001F4C59EC|nr:type I methionyl aminopeptidase [Arsenicicoccus dermatophilus]